jgi:biopolymer transport protein ExbD
MAQRPVENDESLNEVNVIPLADLSLVLLIILMVMSPMVSQAIIQITKAKAAAALAQEDLPNAAPETPVIVSYAPGTLKLNGVVMGSDLEFVTRLDDVMLKRRDKSVILTAAPEILHGKVVRMMDVVKRHGAETLVLLKWDAAAPANQMPAGAHS